jgi:SAM-dependent methyltransferase
MSDAPSAAVRRSSSPSDGTAVRTAVRIQIDDPALQAYIQQHPFLTGPDREVNRRALQAVRASVRVSESARHVPIRALPAAELALPERQERAACELLRAVGLTEAAVEHARRDFGWRAAPVPPDASSILCLGSGAGEELAFLRARAPAARIVVLDYVAKLRPGLQAAVKAEFLQCDLVGELGARDDLHDVVFSNHTLEHLFEPDRVLRLIARRLREGGMLVAGLPLDGDAGTPFQGDVVRMARGAARLHPLDLGVFDAGHPWKTNAADLGETLEAAGFAEVAITQRADEPHRAFADTPHARPGLPRPVLEALYRGLFAPGRRMLRAMLGARAPHVVCRGFVAIERRVPFGAGRLKNGFAPDVVVRAIRRRNRDGGA